MFFAMIASLPGLVGPPVSPPPDLDAEFLLSERSKRTESLVAVGHQVSGSDPHHGDRREPGAIEHRVTVFRDSLSVVRRAGEQIDHDAERHNPRADCRKRAVEGTGCARHDVRSDDTADGGVQFRRWRRLSQRTQSSGASRPR